MTASPDPSLPDPNRTDEPAATKPRPGKRNDGGDLLPASTTGWRAHWHRLIFQHDDPDERTFNLVLILLIAASVVVAMLDSVGTLHARYGDVFYAAEWGFTALFTIEYVVRLLVLKRPMRYVRSFYGVVDLIALLPTYVSLFVVGSQHLLVIRLLRILRVFRILELVEYTDEASSLMRALRGSKRKILLFLVVVLTLTVVFGAVMYVIEGPEHGFTSIPRSMYWAIVTMATVGYGDMTPKTDLGQVITSIIIIIGYGIIAVPTGIYTAELVRGRAGESPNRCPRCGLLGHDLDARYCRRCGEFLFAPEQPSRRE